MKVIRQKVGYIDVEDDAAERTMEEILSRPLFAHLATASEHGPRESPIWFIWEHGALWFLGNYQTDSFPRRLERDARCAVGVVDFNVETGLVQHVGMRGSARLEAHDEGRVKRLFGRYMGAQERWDARFLGVLGDGDWIFVRFEPETVVVRDQSYELRLDADIA